MDESEYRERLNVLEDKLAVVYRERRALMREYAGDHPAVLPPPRARSEAQARIARCPRCGESLRSEVKGAKK